jgi:hypothetical protein
MVVQGTPMPKPAESRSEERPRTSFILPAMTQFDALHAQKYAHIYDPSAIAN